MSEARIVDIILYIEFVDKSSGVINLKIRLRMSRVWCFYLYFSWSPDFGQSCHVHD